MTNQIHINLNDKQYERLNSIIERWRSFKYMGQADHDIRFLLTLITSIDPDENKNE